MRNPFSVRRGAVVLATALGLCAETLLAQSLPLLDQQSVRSPISAGCQDQPDSAPVPVDPRSLVRPGVSQPGQAVQFNTYWVDFHDPEPPFVYPAPPYDANIPPRPKTCGEWRASVARGKAALESKQFFQVFTNASAYESLWRVWGLNARPADFDEQVMKRYGLHAAPFRNPYPRAGENPANSNGGSGQLPLGLIQAKNSAGQYDGRIAVSCSGCHDSRLGRPSEAPFTAGRSNDAFDVGLLVADVNRANGYSLPVLLAPIPWSVGRGGSDAIGVIDYVGVLFNMETLDTMPGMEYFPDHPAAGMTKAPNWWNRAFRTRQFWDGGLSSDNVRSEMAFAVANIDLNGEQRRNLQPLFEDINNYFVSLSPPLFPKAVDTALAEQGAVIFHTRDLWANGANTGIPKQPGNGSCASCHGVYAPRYAADPAFLPDPRLKGVASVVTPIQTVRTDDKRYRLFEKEPMRRAWNSSWWGYMEENPEFRGWNYNPFNTMARYMADYGILPPRPEGPNQWSVPKGYYAPPLYGVWAAAPYLHNGSVPDLWSLLKSSERPKIWKRIYTPGGSGFASTALYKNAGYANDYSAYDFDRLGWKYSVLACNDGPGATPFLPCTNDMTPVDQMYATFANAIAQHYSLAYQTPPPLDDRQIVSRMIMNTHLYSLGNQGHSFSDALSDAERRALIEYLKTL